MKHITSQRHQAYDAFERNIRDRSKIRVKCEIEAK